MTGELMLALLGTEEIALYLTASYARLAQYYISAVDMHFGLNVRPGIFLLWSKNRALLTRKYGDLK